ncbi:hypothetical protein BH11PSE4_BH11PSE4_03710 [soil metagenome]
MAKNTALSGRNVIDFRGYQQNRRLSAKAQTLSARCCKHCGAGLMDGESEDDCSSAAADMPMSRKFRAE